MHQPDYRDPVTGVPVMPWVRLHALRGYTDLPSIVKDTGARVTLNLVPSLVEQLQRAVSGGSDPWRDAVARPAEALSPEEARWCGEHLIAGSPGSFRWFPAWGGLKQKRDAGEVLSTQELRDVQVWSVLAWFGFTALQEHPELAMLRVKGEGFTEADKQLVLAAEREVLRKLPSRWQGLPEVSTSPLTHPILPLLVDTAHARRCLPQVPDPGFRAPEDARLQLEGARRVVEAFVGAPVRGLWPSEGSVSPEVLQLARAAGFRWAATDEGVLLRSEGERHVRLPGARPHHGVWEDSGSGLRMMFRDRELSDRIGFVYASWDGEAAAKDLLERAPEDLPVLLALDGENPWESYADAGEGFLRALLGRARTRTCADLAEESPVGTLSRIHTGSWIDSDFRIWIGHEEDRRAWRLLAEAREAWVSAGRPEGALPHLLAAEGSDWFWWFGEDFSTPFAHLFDRLFRAHLSAVWRASGKEPPSALLQPVKRVPLPGLVAPVGPLPETDGDDWFAWAAAGSVDLRAGSMAPAPGTPRAFRFGARAGRLALRLEASAATEGWSVSWNDGEGRAAFLEDRASLPPEAAAVVLHGPRGERLPQEGAFVLPWREGAAPVPR